jgi:precorrin-2 methylase
MFRKRNAPALAERESVGCLLAGDTDVYATEARLLQHVRLRLPILSAHVGLDRLASFGEMRNAA